MVCYAEKQGKPFWFSSLRQIVQFDTIIFGGTFKNYFGQFVWIEKSHYNSRVSLHEAPTKNITSPGPVVLTAELYKCHKPTFARILQPIFQEAFNGKHLPKSFSSSIISLLPEQQGLKEAKDFRSASLLNMDQKILAHVLANRIKKIKNLVHEAQYGYIKGRSIHDALWDVKHRMTEKDTDWCLVGIDCEKAFDRDARKYMFQVLRKMKFPEVFINIIEKTFMRIRQPPLS